MALAPFADRVKENTTTTGTGSLTLAGAVGQFEAFSTNFNTGDTFYYAIVGQTGVEWEVGLGHLSGATTLVRDVVYQSSNADALVNLSAGTKDVFVTIPGDFMNRVSTNGMLIAVLSGIQFP
jgi:hypothetical protein